MKPFLFFAAAVAASAGFITPAGASDIGVSVTIGQPDFYGRLDIGDYPRPRLLYTQPVLIERDRPRAPIYMRVPPGHAKHWDKHCREYNACGEQVYFVQDDWYTREYVPYYQERHREGHDNHDDSHRGGHDDSHSGDDHGDRDDH